MYKELPLVSFLVLDYKKPRETRDCLESIRSNVKFNYQIIYLDNGGNDDYSFQFYKEGLCDVLISKKIGNGGGTGQADLFRYCNTKYAFFIQNDQVLTSFLTEDSLNLFISLLDKGYKCIDLNGDQSSRGVWTDRAHFIETAFFNSLGPFPNGGPGNDDAPWNEKYLQDVFEKNNYQIAHIKPTLFNDNGKFSIRECGKNKEGITIHRCDNKQMWVITPIKEKCDVFPPLSEHEFNDMINGNWPVWGVDRVGRIPDVWKSHSFNFWPN